MKKSTSIIVILIGILLFAKGISMELPGTDLTTLSSLDGEKNYSTITEYVGGDAYNYIIGASLIGGEVSGVYAMKAIFIAVGSLISSIGLISFGYSSSKETRFENPMEINGEDEDLKAED